MNLENIQGKMSRKEMRNIMAGSGGKCDGYYAACGGTQYSCLYNETRKECYNDYCHETCKK